MPDQLKSDMMWFYEQRLRDSKAGRDLYNQLLRQSFGKCPFCGIGGARTLDHCLPKSKYPRLAVTPANLAPACWECNVEKRASMTGNVSPYFDHWVDEASWLVASLIDTGHPEELVFSAQRPASWDESKWRTLNGFFVEANLADRFQTAAVDEFENIQLTMSEEFDSGGATSVLASLNSRQRSAEAVRINGWRVAAYEAWARAVGEIDWATYSLRI